MILKNSNPGPGEGVESSVCSCRRLWLYSQHPQPSESYGIPVPGDPVPSLQTLYSHNIHSNGQSRIHTHKRETNL